MYAEIRDNIKVQVYNIFLSIPAVTTLYDGASRFTDKPSFVSGLEAICGICLGLAISARVTRQRRRYAGLNKIYKNYGFKNNFRKKG